MWSTKRNAIVSIFVIALLVYGCILLFKDNEFIRSLIAIVALIIAGLASFIWLNKAYRVTMDKQRFFWLILSIGVLFYIASNAIWLFTVIIHRSIAYPEASFYVWLIAYVLFLIALIYKIKFINTSISTSKYIFTIFVFMSFVISIVVHYLINPILVTFENSTFVTATALLYIVISISILFVISILFHLSLFSKEREVMVFIVSGFFLQVVADNYYAYLVITDGYQQAGFVDVIWLIALLMIGVSGKFTKTNTVELDWKIINYFQNKESMFPYVIIISLILLVSYSYEWDFNALSIGLIVVFLMVIVRQLVVMGKNKKLASEYMYLAYHDSLTGLKNRTAFINELIHIMHKAKIAEHPVALLMMDLDRFKDINDTLGHHIGDCVLKEAAIRLKKNLNNNAKVYRIGGDEFVIVLPGSSKTDCIDAANTILDMFHQPFFIGYHEISVTPSIGISMYPTDGLDYQELLKYADAAMYVAKEKGDRYHLFDADLNISITRKMTIEVELRKAIDKNQFVLFYQPKINLNTGAMIGFEALLRWNHPQLGSVSPEEFIPIAEETGQINTIGEWVIRTACIENKDWQDKDFSDLSVSVNVYAKQFEQGNFVAKLESILKETGFSAQFLELEITESIMQDTCDLLEVLKGIGELGVKTTIDDFGTGQSSLHILKELPVNTIKIDKSFIDHIENMRNMSIIKTMIDMGNNLNLEVVAKGIETEEQLKALVNLGCEYGQGYLFSKPEPITSQFE
ncbi:hypothetical protein GCM10011351_30120 [Paraliobacillus quinghaiensis]|uniref:Diguanylate cyclase n=1 Tax=Paraliobacillus quinghaiensis TaxID=470815 RepID=A0A917TWU4_9BACI|nr:EAL domain-containing protein [Paraliobacillus quinghaiensis]GGM42022.1 hypothetical protein GCM10011351_30120 [Paraliobacillus quinghaiensis]